MSPDISELSVLWRHRARNTPLTHQESSLYEKCANELDQWVEWQQGSPTKVEPEPLPRHTPVVNVSQSPKKICSIKGCGNVVKARGWCKKHYQQRWSRHGADDEYVISANGRRVGTPRPEDTCEFPDCNLFKYRNLDLCRGHYELKRDHPDEYQDELLGLQHVEEIVQ